AVGCPSSSRSTARYPGVRLFARPSRPPSATLFPYTTLFRSQRRQAELEAQVAVQTRSLRETTQQLEALHKEKDRLFQNISHELRSEEHTSELQSRSDLVCRLLLEKKKTRTELDCRDLRHRRY